MRHTETYKSENVRNVIAALFLTATSPTAAENEAEGAFRAIRRKLIASEIDPHAIADGIRGGKSFAPHDEAPTLSSMTLGVRRLWLDAIALRVRLSSWERKFIADVRGRALSTMGRLSDAQIRTLQGLVDRAWSRGVRP